MAPTATSNGMPAGRLKPAAQLPDSPGWAVARGLAVVLAVQAASGSHQTSPIDEKSV